MSNSSPTPDSIIKKIQVAMGDMPLDITQEASVATRNAQIIRTPVLQADGKWCVIMAVVPIGGTEWFPEMLELVLIRDGEVSGEVAQVSSGTWTARWDDVEAGDYHIVVRKARLAEKQGG